VAIGTTLICPTSKLGSRIGSVIEGGATNASCANIDTLKLRDIASVAIENFILLFIANPIVLVF
jgi:hypothetical protein